jgi:hypothetical protein
MKVLVVLSVLALASVSGAQAAKKRAQARESVPTAFLNQQLKETEEAQLKAVIGAQEYLKLQRLNPRGLGGLARAAYQLRHDGVIVSEYYIQAVGQAMELEKGASIFTARNIIETYKNLLSKTDDGSGVSHKTLENVGGSLDAYRKLLADGAPSGSHTLDLAVDGWVKNTLKLTDAEADQKKSQLSGNLFSYGVSARGAKTSPSGAR